MAYIPGRVSPADSSVEVDEGPCPVVLVLGRMHVSMSVEEAQRISNELAAAVRQVVG